MNLILKNLAHCFTLLLVLFITYGYVQGQVIFSEDFESGSIPDGWVNETAATDGGWLVGSPASLSSEFFGIPSNGSTRIAATNDDNCNCNKRDEYFITPAIDLSGVEAAVLTFDAYFLMSNYQGDEEEASIEISTDGETWTVLDQMHGHDSWDKHTINLSEFTGEDTVYIGFRYDDNGGWLYGFGIDNVTIEVPKQVDVDLISLEMPKYGEVNSGIVIEGLAFNAGSDAVTSLDISYTVNDGPQIQETLEGLNIEPFSHFHFTASQPWMPESEGEHTIELVVTTVNGTADEVPGNNVADITIEIFRQVEVPNKIDLFLEGEPVITELLDASEHLDKPTDLDFFPIAGKDELWVINQRVENSGGSTVTISDATSGEPTNYWHRVDGNAWHFMSLPTAIAFSDDNFNFGSSPGVKDANHNNGTFTGPTLWSSDPEIYAQPSGGNGSHLDMLHGSPFSMGIAHEKDNVFWVYDDWNKDIVRYDFVDDHGPGNDDHSDGIVRRYRGIGIDADGNIPNHMVLDKETGWLYFVDNGNDRVMRLDIQSGSVTAALPLINEPLAEHSEMGDFTVETIINEGLDRPCGIEIFENRLLVGDYATGEIIIYDMENGFAELGRVATQEPGLTGIKVGPDGNIWFTNRLRNTLKYLEPGETSSVLNDLDLIAADIRPNPTSGMVNIRFPESALLDNPQMTVQTVSGLTVYHQREISEQMQLDLSFLPNGVYLVHFISSNSYFTERLVLHR